MLPVLDEGLSVGVSVLAANREQLGQDGSLIMPTIHWGGLWGSMKPKSIYEL